MQKPLRAFPMIIFFVGLGSSTSFNKFLYMDVTQVDKFGIFFADLEGRTI
jgi:hypothetical protein